jgi:ABC-2 type transport system permease protein
VHERSLDPITSSQIFVAADSAIAQINDRVLESVVATTQDRTAQFTDDVTEAREQLDRVRGSVSDDEIAAAQRGADQLSERLDTVAGTLDQGVGIAQALGLGGRVDELRDLLRESSEQLANLASIDAAATLDRTADALEELDTALSELQSVDADVVVRPFQSDVVSQTPVEMTLDRFYAPGLVALMLQHVALTFAALALVRERRRGTTDLLSVSPVSLGERLAGKAIAFLLLGGVAAAALTALVVAVFGVPVPADWGPFLGLLALTLLASLGYGFLVAAASETESQAVQFSMLFLLTAIFFSGLFLPLDRIGMPAEAVTWLMPATYAFTGLQQLMLLQQDAPAVLYAGLAAIAAVATAAAATWMSLRSRRVAA